MTGYRDRRGGLPRAGFLSVGPCLGRRAARKPAKNREGNVSGGTSKKIFRFSWKTEKILLTSEAVSYIISKSATGGVMPCRANLR